jgi:cytochrome P450
MSAPMTGTCQTSVDGVALPAGAQIYLLLGGANRDDAVRERAGTFDLHHPNVLKH